MLVLDQFVFRFLMVGDGAAGGGEREVPAAAQSAGAGKAGGDEAGQADCDVRLEYGEDVRGARQLRQLSSGPAPHTKLLSGSRHAYLVYRKA